MRSVAYGLLLACVLAIAFPVVPLAAPPKPLIANSPRVPTVTEQYGEQLDIAATPILTLVSSTRAAGYAGMSVDPAQDTLTLYWSGPVPNDVQSLVSRLHSTNKVVVTPSAYSAGTLDAEARRLMDVYDGRDGTLRIVRATARSDYSGLEITLDSSITPSITPSVAASVHSTVPITLKLGHPAIPQSCPNNCSGYRWNDLPAFFGGDALMQNGIAVCSSGFKVQRPDGAAMLTAGHCGLSTQYQIPGNGNVVGSSASCCYPIPDLTTIVGATYEAEIYTGAYTSTTAAPVVQLIANPQGSYRCIGGAWTGEVCNNRVESTQVDYTYIGTTRTGPGVWLHQDNNVAASGPGDSGGPVYTKNPITGDISAAGIDSAGDGAYAKPCQGISETARGGVCTSETWVVDLTAALAALPWTTTLATKPFTTRRITNNLGGRCLDTYSQEGGVDGSQLQLWDCLGAINQAWTYPGDGTIRSAWTGRCLDVPTQLGGNGTRVQLWDCNGGPQQSWSVQSDGSIVNQWTLRCLDADSNTGGANGTIVQIWDCSHALNQQWTFIP